MLIVFLLTRDLLSVIVHAIRTKPTAGTRSTGRRRVGCEQRKSRAKSDGRRGRRKPSGSSEVASRSYSEHPGEAVKEFTRAVVAFCAADPTRFQLLFQRPIPGFEPSPESYSVALRFLERGRDLAAGAGITRQRDMDIFTALVAGIADQQVANDPGGDRWLRLVDEVIDMFLDRLNA